VTTSTTVTVDVHLTDADWRASLAAECAAGLQATPKRLSPVWFYDSRGSELFDQITRLPEYHPTRAERALLDAHGFDIIAAAEADTLVELGSGTSEKTRLLLDAITARPGPARYVPFDVSERTVRDAAQELTASYADLQVHAVVGDFHHHLAEIPSGGRRLVSFLGGTIGNLAPAERHRFLGDLRALTGAGDSVLIGIDLVKDQDTLVRAYDDAAGVTAAFNRNALVHLNRVFDADFGPAAFEHVALWNERDQWIEMHLLSMHEQSVTLGSLGITVSFERGESLRTEISAKFTPERFAEELRTACFQTVDTWTADPGYQLVLARPCGTR
jgi:L-histidine N-alpha-methyltransferase